MPDLESFRVFGPKCKPCQGSDCVWCARADTLFTLMQALEKAREFVQDTRRAGRGPLMDEIDSALAAAEVLFAGELPRGGR